MSFRGFVKLISKVYKYSLVRPFQRFNVENRHKKYLGPDAKKFLPAPRAIGAMSLGDGKPIQYPHLTDGKGFLSLRERRLKALESGNNKEANIVPVGEKKSYSLTEIDDNLIRENISKLQVSKLVSLSQISSPESSNRLAIEAGEQTNEESTTTSSAITTQDSNKPHRPLPTATSLPLTDLSYMYHVERVPPGRLDLVKLQELMINKLADDNYWTPSQIAETYDIKEEYAEKLTKYVKQIQVVVSPMMAKNLDLVGRSNPAFEATKHLIYHVDPALRSEKDRQYDATFSPEVEDLPDDVKMVLEDIPDEKRPYLKDPRELDQENLLAARKPIVKRLPVNIDDNGGKSEPSQRDSKSKEDG